MSDKVVGFAPFFHSDSKVLILGSFPSVKSRAVDFYYGNPQNAFWRIVSSFCCESVPVSVEDKKDFLTRNKIALWDIVTECEITASRDDTIKNFKVANLSEVLQNSQVECILINGGTAYKIFEKHYGGLDKTVIKLPSTSPANTRRKDDEWDAALRRAFKRT
ncbi:MAG: DNA-deoxyinosine glycosylase [Clostridia bacterium]|nr:DNA-deoxyinosine glycosylase [Clostridia bacterium]